MRSFANALILAGLLASLTACKSDPPSGPGDPTAETARPAAAPAANVPAPLPAKGPAAKAPAADADSRPLIVCFGDSLTAGYGADEGQSYPDFLQHDLDQAGFHYRVVNEGVSGNTTKDGVDRLPTVLALHPALVLLEFGGNDGLRGIPNKTTRANLAHIIEALKSGGSRVILLGITLPPDYGPDYVNEFTAAYPALAKRYNLPVLPFLLQNVYGVPGMMQADNIHATDQGNERVARNVLPLVEPLLKK